ncbi:MAG: ABC transporter permease [Chloroflexi bacterium]|nr:ABC transporter permease [Chloroflexota bacterium]
MPAREVWRILWSSASGKAGVLFLSLLVLVSLLVVLTFPRSFGLQRWNNPVYWADNPKSAPPSWTRLLGGQGVHHQVLVAQPKPATFAGQEVALASFTYSFLGPQPPTFISFSLAEVTYVRLPPVLTLAVERPDGREVALYQHIVPGPRPGENGPYVRYGETPFRALLSEDPSAVQDLASFLRQHFGQDTTPQRLRGKVEAALFGTPTPAGEFAPLPGTYTFTIRALAQDPGDAVGQVRLVLGGSTYGLMGTDALGRDLARGLLFGFPVALTIGIVTSLISTFIGTFLGIISGYTGGRTDTVIQRSCDVLNNIPLLPILIFLIFILGQRLWLVVAILAFFGWPGLTIVTRSMVLQIRSGQLVEATRSLGASRWRIMFRHILFQIAPFVLAQMIFFTPAAILAEAGLSFLGLGDVSIPTWGQILEQGFQTGAVYLGYWWWVLPPGLLIVATAMTFVLITLGLEPVVNPRLRQTR